MRARGLKFGILSLALGLATSAAADTSPGGAPPAEPDVMQQASEIVGKATSVSARIGNMLSEAKAEKPKDMMRIACLTRKARQANAASSRITGRYSLMQSTTSPTVRQQQFSVLQVFGQRLTDIETGASQCVGQGAYQASGSSRVITFVRPGGPVGQAAGTVGAPAPAPASVSVAPNSAGRSVPGSMSPHM